MPIPSPKPAPRTFIVSNRLPVTVKHQPDGALSLVRSSGGLVSGLADVHRQGEALWVGYCGLAAEHPDFPAVRQRLLEDRFVAVPLPEADYDAYYNGMANGCLWPLFHYFLSAAAFDRGTWDAYARANRVFADTVLKLAKPHDRIWVHDYQLMLVPGLVRDAQPEAQIAYFHHIPFPAVEMFRVLPARTQLLRGLLGADLIGLHTLEYVMNLQTATVRLLGLTAEKDHIRYRGRSVRVGAFPLGVDIEALNASMRDAAGEGRVAELASVTAGKTVFLGIDRLDYTKGIPERLRGFGQFLKEHPEVIGEVVNVQVCVPSREDVPSYAQLRDEVERLVGRINGEYSRPGYVPVHYLYQPFLPDEVHQFYKLGDIALVTPLCDGLNLVCKEYVASRDDDEGILILSEFAGAAAEMGEALLVNPFDVDALARAMHVAFKMPSAERRRRMRHLRARVALNDNHDWARAFLLAWSNKPATGLPRRSRPLDAAAVGEAGAVLRAGRLLLCLDYDGTLVPIRAKPELAVPSAPTRALLARLGALPNAEVAIITGRSRDFCDRYLGDLPVWIAAEHSGFYRLKGETLWRSAVDLPEIARLKAEILPHFQDYVSRMPGARIEEKATALVLHYRETESVFAHRQAYGLRESLNRILANTPFSAFQAKLAIEVKPIASSKAHAVEHFLALWRHQDELFLTAGDDRTDDDMFTVKPEHNLSIHVGHSHGTARYHVESPAALSQALREILRCAPARPEGRRSRRPPAGASARRPAAAEPGAAGLP